MAAGLVQQQSLEEGGRFKPRTEPVLCLVSTGAQPWFPSSGATQEGVCRCAELSRNRCKHHSKSRAFCGFDCLTLAK